MSQALESTSAPKPVKKHQPFRRAVLRGLAFVLPPLLTLVFFIWTWSVVEKYLLRPVEGVAATAIVWSIKDVKKELPRDLDPAEVEVVDKDNKRMSLEQFLGDAKPLPDFKAQVASRKGRVEKFQYEGTVYVAVKETGRWIPENVYKTVEANPGDQTPNTTDKYYDRYVRLTYLRRTIVVPVFVCVFTLILYMIGKFVAAGIGRFVWRSFEALIQRMPIIRDVYSAVKQMTDLVLSEQEMQFMRVVAIEYPRKGVWALAFVMGEGFRQIRDQAQEPIYSLLVPTSPMPATGFTINIRRSECLELDISIDQAVQFIVSCGVVIAPHQQWQKREESAKLVAEVQSRMNAAIAEREASELPTA